MAEMNAFPVPVASAVGVALPIEVEGIARPVAVPAPEPALPAEPRLGRRLLIGGVVGYLALVLVLPLAALVAKALGSGAGETVRALSTPEAGGALLRSLVLVLLALVLNGALGTAAALVLVRQRFPGRRLFDALVDLPLALSPVMVGLAVLLLFGRGGWLAPVMEAAGLRVAFAFPGLVLCTLLVTLPFTIREVGHVLEEQGAGDEEAAATLGATPWQTFRRVTLPNVRQGLNFGLVLTTARALGEFGAVLVVGGAVSGRTQTATTFIYAAVEERQEAAAYGMALLLAAASLLLLFGLETFKHREES
jgi:sulfate transport system permease protein